MKLGHSADEIKYDATEGTVARYLVILEGEPVMSILCDSTDPEKIIRVTAGFGGGFNDLPFVESHATAGRFTMTQVFLEGPDGEPLGMEERVSEKSVYTYVVPRLHVLLGRLLRAA